MPLFSSPCVERLHLWSASVPKLMEGWNTQTENVKVIVGMSRLSVTLVVSATSFILRLVLCLSAGRRHCGIPRGRVPRAPAY